MYYLGLYTPTKCCWVILHYYTRIFSVKLYETGIPILTSISYLARNSFPASPEPPTLRFHCASSCCNSPHTSSYLLYSSGMLISFAFQFNNIMLYGLLRNLSRNGHDHAGLELNLTPAFWSHGGGVVRVVIKTQRKFKPFLPSQPLTRCEINVKWNSNKVEIDSKRTSNSHSKWSVLDFNALYVCFRPCASWFLMLR